MKRTFLLALLVTSAALSATTAQEQAYFAIFAETKVMRIAGMEIPEMPELPPGVSLPGGISLPGKPTKNLNVRLWSPSIAPDGATASLAPPAGLKVGSKLDLGLYRPTEQENTGSASGPGSVGNPDFTIKVYWGSSDKVREGQPRLIKWGVLTPEQKAEMNKRAREAQPGGQGSYFYKPNWTTGYWPVNKGQGALAKEAALPGNYTLSSSYTGNVSIDVPNGVDFLAPFEFSTPNLNQELDLSKALGFQWKGIPNALGQHAMAMGAEGKNTMIIWTSSEDFSESVMGDTGFLQMAEVRQNVANKTFMAPEQTKVTIPAGIFKDADFAMLNMVAYGPGAALDKAQPLPRVQTKSSVQVILGGKEMR